MQTKIIEINLLFKPEVADAILGGGQFSHYDRPRIAQLCEKAGLYMRAMQHYSDLSDIRRVMVRFPLPCLYVAACTDSLQCTLHAKAAAASPASRSARRGRSARIRCMCTCAHSVQCNVNEADAAQANTHAIQPEALKEFFGDRLSADWALECLADLVQNPQVRLLL